GQPQTGQSKVTGQKRSCGFSDSCEHLFSYVVIYTTHLADVSIPLFLFFVKRQNATPAPRAQ
ncbi:MAG: hypothetical protein FWF69_03010, partial [Firmicutes bacterium]|nr:hypothetical protein [Bacillota bacterium]